MSLTSTRLATVRTAHRPGPDRPSEDRIFTADNAVVVLDGASQPEPSQHDGGWLADTLGRQIIDRLDEGDLARVLRDAIAIVAAEHRLTPGQAPSTTVSIVRWNDRTVDALVLGDSPVIAQGRDGALHHVRDDRLMQVAARQRDKATRAGYRSDNPYEWRALVNAERAQRNEPGGYWIAEADPEAAVHAVRAQWPRDELDAVLVMTDGVSAGVDRYGEPADWPTAARIGNHDPDQLVRLVHDTEASDPHGDRWPRSKVHDDKALAVITFDRP